MVSLVSSHTNATSKRWHLWEIDLRFASGLPPGWFRTARPLAGWLGHTAYRDMGGGGTERFCTARGGVGGGSDSASGVPDCRWRAFRSGAGKGFQVELWSMVAGSRVGRILASEASHSLTLGRWCDHFHG